MKKYNSFGRLVLTCALLAALSVVLMHCDDDDDGDRGLRLRELKAGNVDLNAATTPSNVPTNATITASFTTDIDPSSATSDNVKLIRQYDDAEVDIDIAASGNTITISPVNDLGTGTTHMLRITGLQSAGGEPLNENIERSFTTEGTFAPSGVVAHWTFEDNADDQVGDFHAAEIVDVEFVEGRNEAAGMAASFNGTTSIIEIPNGPGLINTNDFSLSFWVKVMPQTKTNGDAKGHFVMGLGGANGFQFEVAPDLSNAKLAARYSLANGNSAAEDLWLDATGNLGWQGWTFSRDLSGSGGLPALIEDQWAHVVCTYDSESKEGKIYVNGELMKSQDFDLYGEGHPLTTATGLTFHAESGLGDNFVFGFINDRSSTLFSYGIYTDVDANHFHGELDDVRIFHTALSEQEVELMYNSEQP